MISELKNTFETNSSSELLDQEPEHLDSTDQKTNSEALSTLRNLISRQANSLRKL